MKIKIKINFEVAISTHGVNLREQIKNAISQIDNYVQSKEIEILKITEIRTKATTYGKYFHGHAYKCPLCGHITPFSKVVEPDPDKFLCEKCHMPLRDEDMCSEYVCNHCGKPIDKGAMVLNVESPFCNFSCLQKVWDPKDLYFITDESSVDPEVVEVLHVKQGILSEVIKEKDKLKIHKMFTQDGYVYTVPPPPFQILIFPKIIFCLKSC